MNDAVNDPSKQSTAGGVSSAASLGRGHADPNDHKDPDRFPDQRPVIYGEDPVDVDDDEAVAQALADGRRDLIDASKMTLERRMRFGLLTPEDDKARVEGRLGDHVAAHDGGAQRTNVYESKAGSDTKDRNKK